MAKLTKKQKTEIARIYAGSILMHISGDDHGTPLSEDDYSEILMLTQELGTNILRNRPTFHELGEIYKHVIEN